MVRLNGRLLEKGMNDFLLGSGAAPSCTRGGSVAGAFVQLDMVAFCGKD